MRAVALTFFLVVALVLAAEAQVRRPGDERLELPPFEVPERKPGTILPPVPIPLEPARPQLEGALRVLIHEILVSGATVLSAEEITQITNAYANRELSFADIQALQDRLTLEYVERGYVTSGAVIPNQSIDDGLLEIQIVEGRVSVIEIETDGRLADRYLRRRIDLAVGDPINVLRMEKRLQILQQDHRIRAVQARLAPAAERSESILRVSVVEARSYDTAVEYNNYESPAIGSHGGLIEASHANISGYGDSVRASFKGTEGLWQLDTRYEVPITAWDTTLDFHFAGSWSEIVEDPFDDLNVENRSFTYGFTLRQPLYRSLETTVQSFIVGEYRRNTSYLDDSAFSFTEGPDDGVSEVAVLRLGGSWSHRSRSQVFAARSMLSWGLDALGATKNLGDTPDGRFVAWLGQVQWARRLEWLDLELVAGGDVQLSNDALLGIEQFAVGGRYTVRGYRENQLVRDQGLIGSLEARIPVIRAKRWADQVEIVPFVDYGRSWNRDRVTEGPRSVLGIGVGLRWLFTEWCQAQLYWAKDIRDVDSRGDWDLQDDGVFLMFRVELPKWVGERT